MHLVFFGEVVAGYAIEDAKRNLARVLGIDSARTEEVFSGQRVVLKKAVSAEDAPRYVEKLKSMGIVVHAEAATAAVEPPRPVVATPFQASPATIATPANAPTATVVTAKTADQLALVEDKPPAAEEMECPKCGTRQPKRTLCISCQTDMPRFIAARNQAEAEQKQARPATTPQSKKGQPREVVEADEVDPPGWFGLSTEGRLGRLSYLAGGLAVTAALLAAIIPLALGNMPIVMMMALAVGFIFTVRLVVLRCHDVDWSGWWALLLLVPYVGSAFSFILLVIPGTRGSNNYGDPPRAASALTVILALVAMAGVGLFAASKLSDFMATLQAEAAAEVQQESQTE